MDALFIASSSSTAFLLMLLLVSRLLKPTKDTLIICVGKLGS